MSKFIQAALWGSATMLIALAEMIGWAPEGIASRMILIVPLAAAISMGMWQKSEALNCREGV